MLVILGIGSNLGDRRQHLCDAVQMLVENTLSAVSVSSVYESTALLKESAPHSWDIPFLNIAIAGETSLTPEALLRQVKMIERRLGRKCTAPGLWAPREIDIDILAYGEQEIAQDGLAIPHKELLNRDFALIPLAEIEPHWRYPLEGESYHKTAYELAQRFSDSSIHTHTSSETAVEYAE